MLHVWGGEGMILLGIILRHARRVHDALAIQRQIPAKHLQGSSSILCSGDSELAFRYSN